MLLVNLLLCVIMLSVTYTCIHTSIMKSLEIMIGTGGTAPSTCETLSFVETSVPNIRCTSSAVNVEPSPLSPVYRSTHWFIMAQPDSMNVVHHDK